MVKKKPASWSIEARTERHERVSAVVREMFPEPRCELDYRSPFELLIAVILSAQTTDKLVNTITPALFARYPTAQKLAKAPLLELRKILKRIGFFRAKARSIRGTAKLLVKNHQGEVPKTMAELIKLKGVARKTANVVLGEAFGLAEGIAVDTHVMRVSKRLALTRHSKPPQIERDLMESSPRTTWAKDHLRLVLFGRYHCTARSPHCEGCPLRAHCFAPEAQE